VVYRRTNVSLPFLLSMISKGIYRKEK